MCVCVCECVLACAVCTIWFVWETVSLVLCARLTGQRWASGEVVFLLRVPLGLYESVRERRIYCYTLVLTHIHTQFCLSASYIHILWVTFPPLSCLIPGFHCCRSIRMEERRSKRWKREEEEEDSFYLPPHPFFSFFFPLTPFISWTCQFVLSGICLAWLNKANHRAFV